MKLLVLLLVQFCICVAIWLYFRRKFIAFSDTVCQSMERILHGQPVKEYLNRETLTSKMVTELEKVEDIVRYRLAENEREKQELQEMISEITHQIKTPLSNIRMYCEMIGENASSGSGETILRQTDSSLLRQYSATVGDQLDRLDFLLNALIRSSRLETSMIRLQLENNKVLNTIAIAVNNVFQKAEEKKTEIRVGCRSTIEVCHDPKWTAEAIENLLDNAIKYTPENGKIQIDVVPGEMYVEIQVKDTGCGIAADEVNEIFKRFYRGKAVSRVEGLGLGLYLAQKIITLQGGFLSVHSEPGNGSCFSIHLRR
mgnify:CR=1 FL=1